DSQCGSGYRHEGSDRRSRGGRDHRALPRDERHDVSPALPRLRPTGGRSEQEPGSSVEATGHCEVVSAALDKAMSYEIVDGSASGGTNTSHTIVLPALCALLDAVPPSASLADYSHAVLDDNILGKATEGSRKRTFRYLRELYLLRPDSILFRALRDLWP